MFSSTLRLDREFTQAKTAEPTNMRDTKYIKKTSGYSSHSIFCVPTRPAVYIAMKQRRTRTSI